MKKKSIFLCTFVLLDCLCAFIIFQTEYDKGTLKKLATANSLGKTIMTEKIDNISADVTYTIESNTISQEDLMTAQEIMLNQQVEQVQHQLLTSTTQNLSTSSAKSLATSNEASNKAAKEAAAKKIKPPKITYTGDIKSVKGADIAAYAKQFKGNPYVWGGTSLTNGADCSGFVQSVYKSFGINIPRTASKQALVGTEVSIKNIQPGDLVFYSSGGTSVTHVALYIGNNKIIHARTPRLGIGIDSVFIMRRLHIRRIVNN